LTTSVRDRLDGHLRRHREDRVDPRRRAEADAQVVGFARRLPAAPLAGAGEPHVGVERLLETEIGWRAQGDRIRLEAAATVLLSKRRSCERRQSDLGWKTGLVGAD
jgi:hypothetical protein